MIEKAISRHVLKHGARTFRRLDRIDHPPDALRDGKARALYLHIPFCREPCDFCTFQRVRFEEGLAVEYFRALRQEIGIYGRMGCSFRSLYVGGGTPTVLPEELARTISLVRSLWDPAVISVETNPDNLTGALCGLLRGVGVNRLSIGVQTFQEELLRRLGRRPAAAAARALSNLEPAMKAASTVNLDMLFDMPGQTEDLMRRDVEEVLRLSPSQVTFYPLMPSSKEPGRSGIPSRKNYDFLVDRLSGPYRLSSGWCFSRRDGQPTDEYVADNDQHVGLGSGAFSYVDGTLYASTFSIPAYLRAVGEGRFPLLAGKRFSQTDRMRYYSLMRFFMARLELGDARREFGRLAVLRFRKDLLLFACAGLCRRSGSSLEVTRKGRYVSMLMMWAFYSAVSGLRDRCRALSAGEKGALG